MKFLPLASHPSLCFEHVDHHGALRHVVVLRATFTIESDGRLSALSPQPRVGFAERSFGEVSSSPPRDESHLAPEKPAVDVIVHANAYAPEGRASPRFGATISVWDPRTPQDRPAPLAHHAIVATGPREWSRGVFGDYVLSDCVPVTEVPLRFDFAFGGTLRIDDPARGAAAPLLVAHPDNPVGRGYVPSVEELAARSGLTTGSARALLDDWKERHPRVAAPQLEHPSQPVRSLSDRPALWGWGLVAKHWALRYRYAGTYDEAWMRTRYPVLPTDFDPRYWNGAHPALQLPELPEDAVVVLDGVMPPASGSSSITLRLPGVRPQVTWRDMALDGPQRGRLRLDTVHIDLLENQLTLLYRFSLPAVDSLAWLEVTDTLEGSP